MDLKIDSRARPITPRDEELIAALRTQAAETGLFVLSEVALGYLDRKAEAIKVTMAIQKSNGGIRFRSATIPTSERTNKLLRLVDGYARAPSPVDSGIPVSPIASEDDWQIVEVKEHGGRVEAFTYTVKAGDTLSKIAKEFYGKADEYSKLIEANRDKLSTAGEVQVGQKLVIPSKVGEEG